MALCPRITVYPGLGEVTVLEPGQSEVRGQPRSDVMYDMNLRNLGRDHYRY